MYSHWIYINLWWFCRLLIRKWRVGVERCAARSTRHTYRHREIDRSEVEKWSDEYSRTQHTHKHNDGRGSPAVVDDWAEEAIQIHTTKRDEHTTEEHISYAIFVGVWVVFVCYVGWVIYIYILIYHMVYVIIYIWMHMNICWVGQWGGGKRAENHTNKFKWFMLEMWQFTWARYWYTNQLNNLKKFVSFL